MKNLGSTIKSTRVAKDLPLVQTALAAGISDLQLDQIEEGKSIPTEKIVKNLAKVLEADVDDLLQRRSVLVESNFRGLVQEMRSAQKEYFTTRDRIVLEAAKRLERQVDLCLASSDFDEERRIFET